MNKKELDALIVGAGFAGIYQLMELRDAGLNVKVIDNASQIGGIWYWNCYPGARVDSTAPLYQYSKEELWKDWDYSELFPSWDEIREYFKYVDQKKDLSKDVYLNTGVESARFDVESNRWIVSTDTGETLTTRFFILCTGFASKPLYPDVPGIETFSGVSAHAGRWPQEGVDFTDKKIAIIGTGSSAVQMAEQASLSAKQLTIFQRTPALALPLYQVKLDGDTQKSMKKEFPEIMKLRRETFAGFDYEFLEKSWNDYSSGDREKIYDEQWKIGAFRPWLGFFREVIADEDASNTAYTYWRKKVHARVNDPVLAEQLAPETPPIFYGTKRMGLEQWYFEIFNQDNVELVNIKKNPIIEITESGVKTQDKLYEFDIILYGTGFDAVSGGIASIDIKGDQEETIAEHWSNGFRTAYGTCSSGFPNLFFIYGPQSPASWSNGPTLAECQGDWVVNCIKYMRDHNYNRIVAKPELEEYWLTQVNEAANATLLPRTRSWWFGGNIPGRPLEALYYAGGIPRFLEELESVASNGYEGFELS